METLLLYGTFDIDIEPMSVISAREPRKAASFIFFNYIYIVEYLWNIGNDSKPGII